MLANVVIFKYQSLLFSNQYQMFANKDDRHLREHLKHFSFFHFNL